MANEPNPTKAPVEAVEHAQAKPVPKPARVGGNTISLSPNKNKAPALKSDALVKANTKIATAKLAGLLAIVRIRGVTGINPKRQHTLELLSISRSHNATLVPATPIIIGMLKQAKDYISWGPLSENVLVSMLTKRGCTDEGDRLREVKKPEEIKALASKLMNGATLKSLGVARTFRLTPPSGGFKDKKKNYPIGDLGVRPSMDDAIKAMI